MAFGRFERLVAWRYLRPTRGEGFISVITVVETSLGQIVSGPEIHAKGVAEDDHVFDKIKPQIADALEKAMKDGTTDHHQLQQIVRRTIGRWVGTKLRRKAMIVPVVVVV